MNADLKTRASWPGRLLVAALALGMTALASSPPRELGDGLPEIPFRKFMAKGLVWNGMSYLEANYNKICETSDGRIWFSGGDHEGTDRPWRKERYDRPWGLGNTVVCAYDPRTATVETAFEMDRASGLFSNAEAPGHGKIHASIVADSKDNLYTAGYMGSSYEHDWMTDWIDWSVPIGDKPFPVGRGSRSYPATEYMRSRPFLTGFSNAAHLRAVTRNNWYAKPTPRPLNHGQSWWPWDGYLNWHDERTPRNKQYSWHTDRPQDMWPDLNMVHIDATASFGNERLFLHFETYTPNFDRFEANPNGDGWRTVPADWTWFLDSGRNTLEVRAVNKSGVRGKAARVALNLADRQLGDWYRRER